MSAQFAHRHLLDTDVLTVQEIDTILNLAERYAEQNRSKQKKSDKLKGKNVVNLFFEPSTRTRTSFEIAAKRLGADVVNIDIETSSTKKGETLLDTAQMLDAMLIDAIVIRHAEQGVPQLLTPHVNASIINAGDGKHAHPTQALLDALTIKRNKGRLEGLVVAICGDVSHSRVARSNLHLLKKCGAQVRLIAPPYFMTKNLHTSGVEVFTDMEAGLRHADVVMMLRIQHERMGEGEFAVSLLEYHDNYGLTHDRLKVAKPDVIVLHPGPVNRGVEITNELADDLKYSRIREQVEMGVASRMAILDLLLSP